MNKFKKPSKSKSLTLGIAILSSAAIVSTGFAAWVITGGAEVSVSGTITADEVENNQHTIKFTKGDPKNLGEIFYGRPDSDPDPKTQYNWVSSNSTKKQSLSLSATFTVANVNIALTNDADSIGKIIDANKTAFEETTDSADASTKYATLADSDKAYVAALPEVILGGTDTDSVGVHITLNGDVTDKIATFDLKIVFGWGGAFQNKNPYVYYGGQEYTEALGTEATTRLEAIHKMNATFNLTLVTK